MNDREGLDGEARHPCPSSGHQETALAQGIVRQRLQTFRGRKNRARCSTPQARCMVRMRMGDEDGTWFEGFRAPEPVKAAIHHHRPCTRRNQQRAMVTVTACAALHIAAGAEKGQLQWLAPPQGAEVCLFENILSCILAPTSVGRPSMPIEVRGAGSWPLARDA